MHGQNHIKFDYFLYTSGLSKERGVNTE